MSIPDNYIRPWRHYVVATIACTVFWASVGYAIWTTAGYHIVWKPTQDQIYGCTVAQQAPNGDCK